MPFENMGQVGEGQKSNLPEKLYVKPWFLRSQPPAPKDDESSLK